MGYYTGNGVVSSGGSSTNLRSAGYEFGPYRTYNRTKSVVESLNGVSLASCQSNIGEINMTDFVWPNGYTEVACKGTRKSVSYSQIGGSNLYALNITTETIEFRGINIQRDTGWVS